MIKAFSHEERAVLLGLSAEDVELIKRKKTAFIVDLKEIGIESKVIIFYGHTEQAMKHWLDELAGEENREH